MLIVLTVGYILLCYADACITYNRIQDYGKWIELNPIVRKYGVTWGILIPGTFIAGFCLYFNLTILLAIITGMRLKMFHYQLLSKNLGASAKAITPSIAHPSMGPKPPMSSQEGFDV
jgi:hypothetical protein